MNQSHFSSRWIVAFAVVGVAVVAYLPSFNAWFFLDDFRTILENPALHSVFDPAAVWQFSQYRFIASLSLAANYTLHGEQVFGYHLVNFLSHLVAGASLWLLVRAINRTLALENAPSWMHWTPWIALAVFLLHPLQTQAVTYIVQRYTSLMAMFYLASMAAFAWGRLRGDWRLLLASALFAALALFSKQTAATLPLALVLIELVFFRRLSARAWASTLAAAAGLALLAAWLVSLPALDLVGLTRESDKLGRLDYLATQMQVLWRYIGLFFLFGEQRFEYAIDVADGFSAPLSWLAAAGHLGLVALGAALWRRQPLVAFGILFYYLAHAVESSFLPIIDVAFEHRTYLPNAGLAIAVASVLSALAARLTRWHAGALLALAILAVLGAETWQRNRLWADPIAFLTRDAELSPESQRAWTSLGKELLRAQRFEEGLKALDRAMTVAKARDGSAFRPPTLLNMLFALHYTGRNEKALEFSESFDNSAFNASEMAFFHEARGRARLALGRFQEAREDLTAAAHVNPSIAVVTYLAAAELGLGNRARAAQLARQVLVADPDNSVAREIYDHTR